MDDVVTGKPRLTRDDLQVIANEAYVDGSEDIDTALNDYPHCLSIESPYRPYEEKSDPYASGKAEFEILRHESLLEQRLRAMEIHLSQEGIHNFRMLRKANSVEFYFTTTRDVNMAKTLYLKEGPRILTMQAEDPGIPIDAIRQHASYLQKEYNEMGLKDRVKVWADKSSKSLQTYVKDKRALVAVMGNDIELDLTLAGPTL